MSSTNFLRDSFVRRNVRLVTHVVLGRNPGTCMHPLFYVQSWHIYNQDNRTPKEDRFLFSYRFINIRARRPLCPLLVRHVPPGTDLCPAQSIPGHKPIRRAAAPHQQQVYSPRPSHRTGDKPVPRQSIVSAKRISHVPSKFSKIRSPAPAVRLPTKVLLVMLNFNAFHNAMK